MTDPIETAELLAFARTVELSSLSRAASELRVPRATISRRLARLESRLKVRLLKRTTRRLTLTDAGQALYTHARGVLDAVARAEQCVRKGDGGISGELRVSVPPIRSVSFMDLVVGFAKRHPDVTLHLNATTQYVDLLGSGYDVALRASIALQPGLVARTVAKTRVLAVASPAYLAAHGTPKRVEDLREHRCLGMFQRGEVPETHWPLVDGKRLRVQCAFYSNDVELLAYAAAQDLGIAIAAESFVRDAIAAGKLVPVLEDVLGTESRVSIVYAEREFVPPQVRAFIDELGAWAPKELMESARPACPKPEAPARARKARSSTNVRPGRSSRPK